MFKYLLILFSSLFWVQLTNAQNQWIKKEEFPGTERWGAYSFVINDVAYYGMGDSLERDGYKKDFYQFTPATQDWVKLDDVPFDGRSRGVSFSIDGYGYIGLGRGEDTVFNSFHKYDPTTDTWSEIAEFPGDPRYAAAGFVIDGKAYVGSGIGKDYFTASYKDFYVYDPNTDIWTPISDFPKSIKEAIYFSINGKGYLASGYNNANGSAAVYTSVESYDPVSDTWQNEVFASPYLSKKEGGVFTANGKAFLIGGSTSGAWTKKVVLFNPASNEVSEYNQILIPDDSTYKYPSTFVVGDTAYVVGGLRTSFGGRTLNEFYAMNIDFPLEKPSNNTYFELFTPEDGSVSIEASSIGNGSGRAVFLSEKNTGIQLIDNVEYAANSNFKDGEKLGDFYCVYNGTGDSFDVTGLEPNTNYYLTVVEYNQAEDEIAYIELSSYKNFNFSTYGPPSQQASNLEVEFDIYQNETRTEKVSFNTGNGNTTFLLVTTNFEANLPSINTTYSHESDLDLSESNQIGDWHIIKTQYNIVGMLNAESETTYKIVVLSCNESDDNYYINYDTTGSNIITYTPPIKIDNGGLGLFDSKSKKTLETYPNPTDGLITIQLEEKTDLKVINSLGRIVLTKSNLSPGLVELNISELPNGVYTIITNSSQRKISKK